MNVLEDYITFLIWAAWILFNLIFILSKKKRFSVWSYTENTSFISSHERIYCRYSETNPSKRSKDLSFRKKQKHTKKMKVSKTISRIRKLFASQDIHYNNNLNIEVKK